MLGNYILTTIPLGNRVVEATPKPLQTEIKERIDEAWDSLIEALEENPKKAIKDFIEYSKSANITRFGWLNKFTIYSQTKGQARFVHTAEKWKKLGREIKPGARPIPIFVVIPARYNSSNRPYIYWEFNEYDISQTEGEYIKEPTPIEANPLHTKKLWRALKIYCCELGLKFADKPFPVDVIEPSVLGGTDGKQVYVRSDLPITQKVRVLAHEIAHVLMHFPSRDKPFVESENGSPPDNSIREVEADSVACLVCSAWGIDVTKHSKYYLMLYTDDQIRPHQIARGIFKTVRQILTNCNPKGYKRKITKRHVL